MAGRIRDFDWSSTPLGPAAGWPQSLKTLVDTILAMPSPAAVRWGPQHVEIYNDAFVAIARERHPALLGKPASLGWAEVYDEVVVLLSAAMAGQATQLRGYVSSIDGPAGPEERVFDADWSPVRDESGAVAGVLQTLSETTGRHRAEAALRESEERQAFLLKLSDALRPLADTGEITEAATRLLAGYLGANRAYYVEWPPDAGYGEVTRDYATPGLASLSGRYPIAAFKSAYDKMSEGRTWIVSDNATADVSEAERDYHAQVGVIAWVDVPLIKRGTIQAALCVVQDRPRDWTATEIALVEETAERLWGAIERGLAEAALRESEARLAAAFESVPVGLAVIGMDGKIVTANEEYRRYLPSGLIPSRDPTQAPRWRAWDPEGRPLEPGDFPGARAMRGERVVPGEDMLYAADDGREVWTRVASIPIRDAAGQVTAIASVISDIDAIKRTTDALRDSEAQYRTLFDAVEQGVLVLERATSDSTGELDFRYLAVNAAFERQTGLPDIVGKTIREAVPGVGQEVFDSYDAVARTGEPWRFENYIAHLDRWFEGEAVLDRVSGHIVVLFSDITERRRIELALRESEERQAFLLKLSDALRPLVDPVTIQEVATRVLGEQLGASRAAYVELNGDEYVIARDYVDGAPSMVGRHPVTAFGPGKLPEYHTGKTRVVPDTGEDIHNSPSDNANFAAFHVRAGIGVPLIKGGKLVANLVVHMNVPRNWSAQEVALVEETAERTWQAVERARAEAALLESQERLRQFGEASQDVLWIRDVETMQWVYLTPAFEKIYGLSREEALSGNDFRGWLDLIVPEDRQHVRDSIERVYAGEHVSYDFRIRRPIDGAIRWMRNTDFPIIDANGKVTLIGGIGRDATELREAELRLQTLIEGIPQLVWRAVDGGHWTWASPQWMTFTGKGFDDSLGWGWLDGLHPDDRPAARDAWSHALETGGFEVEYRLCHAAQNGYRWFQTRATPVRDEAGAIVEWLGTSTDIHDIRDLQERQHVLVAELQHRTRNLMGVVRSTADKTARGSVDIADFRSRFRVRLESLARVQGLLSRLNEHDRVTFDELLRSELSVVQGSEDRVTLEGPMGVRLRSSTVQTLAMALHELATNAVKYGALGKGGGALAVRWSIDAAANDGQPWLHIDWRESGVTMPQPGAVPTGAGQGRELIERALPYQLKARTSYVLGPDGVHCTISTPVSASTGEGVHEDV